MFKSLIWAFVEKGGQFICQFIGVVILSRFISPEAFGIYGIMSIFISISEMLVDSGFGGAIIQKKDINPEDVNTLFLSNVSISIVLYLFIIVISPLVARLYSLPELKFYLQVLGITIVLYSFTLVHITLLQRNLKLRESALITLCASIVSVIGATVCAIEGFGIWALIIQQILMSFTLALLLWLTQKCYISFSFSKKSFVDLWNFGSKLLAANLLQTIYNNICTSIIPKISTIKVSGMYYQAARINNIPTSIVQTAVDKAVFPILSKEESIPEVLNRARTINISIVSVLFPIFALISLFSREIIIIILGEKWFEASSFLRILAWGGCGLLIQALYRNIYKSIGKTKTILKIDTIKTIIGLILLTLSSFWGVKSMIYVLTLSMYIGTILYAYDLHYTLHLSIKVQIKDILIPTLISFFLFFAFSLFCNNLAYHWYNISISLLYLLFYLLLNVLFKNTFFYRLYNYLINQLKS